MKAGGLDLPEGPFSGYIFDCDGTLADTMPLHYRAWRRIVREFGGDFPEELFYGLGGKPTELIFELLAAEHGLNVPDVAAASALKEEYFAQLVHEVAPIDAVVELAHASFRKVPMAVASGGLRKYVELTLDVLKIRHLFDTLVCFEDVSRPKPAPDPFLEAARRLAVPPAECLVFEDSPLGVQAAQAAGMRWVLVPRTTA